MPAPEGSNIARQLPRDDRNAVLYQNQVEYDFARQYLTLRLFVFSPIPSTSAEIYCHRCVPTVSKKV
jgi:hypothetical protein